MKARAASCFVLLGVLVVACAATVRQSDLDAWRGRPVADLDKHPVFLTMPMLRTKAADGTEIRNYVNGRNIAACSGGATSFALTVDMATYSNFLNCMQGFPACNNIFYIQDGLVQKYTPIGTGGAKCFTDERARPDFNGPTNIN